MLNNKVPSFRDSLSGILSFRRGALFVIIFMNAQIFSLSVWNPMGVKGFQETLYIFLLFFAFFYIYSCQRHNNGIAKVDLIVILLIFSMWFYSAVAAAIKYGQPIHFGLIEERRMFSLLVYFPLVWGLRKRIISEWDVLNYLTIFAVFGALISVGITTDLISPINEIDFRESSLRQDRYAVAQHYLCWAIIYCAYLLHNNIYKARSILIATFLAVILLVVVQGRQLLFATAIALVVIFVSLKRNDIIKIPIFILFLILAVFSSFYLFPSLAEKYALLFSGMFSNGELDAGARSKAYSVVIEELGKGNLFGQGALSLMWENGFHRVYGEYFVLADIGFMGTLFKFGIFSAIFYLAYFYIQAKGLLGNKKNSGHRLYLAYFFFIVASIPLAAPLEFRGFLVGLLLALTLARPESDRVKSTSG